MPVTFAEDATDATGEEAKAADEARVTRDAPLARWASTPSFLTGSLSTNNGASMDNEREPDSPTTTEQPRPTNFDSVPSIPSDLF